MEVPSADVVNGIIRGYHVIYQETNELGEMIGENMTADFKRIDEVITVGKIEGLEEFTWYSFQARAYTSIGYGPNSTRVTSRTFEDGKFV